MPTIEYIVIKPAEGSPPEGAYYRVPVEAAVLIPSHGIEGCLKSGQPERALNIVSVETLESLAKDGYDTQPGRIGEQIGVSGILMDALESGTRVQLGSDAVIEIIMPRTGCSKFESHQGLSRTGAANRMGMIARVIAGGPIRVGDEVALA